MIFKNFSLLRSPDDGDFGGGGLTGDAPETPLAQTPPADSPLGEAPPAQTPPAQVTIPENWKEALSEEIRKDPNLEKFKNFEDLANSYIHLQKHVGHDKVIIPGKNSEEKDWEVVYSKLGRPETPDAYKLELKSTLKEDKDFTQNLQKAAHAAGLNPNQLTKLSEFLDSHNETVTKQMQEEAQSYTKKAQEDLKKEWGEKFDTNLKNAQKAFKAFTDEDTFEYVKNSGIGNDPKLIKIFANIAEKMKEDSGNLDGDNTLMTPNQVQQQIETIMGDPNHPYWNSNHPKHETAVKEMYALQSKM